MQVQKVSNFLFLVLTGIFYSGEIYQQKGWHTKWVFEEYLS